MTDKPKLFKDVMAEYSSAKNPRWTKLSPRSKQIYENGLRHLGRFMDVPVKDITRPMIVEFRNDMFHMTGVCRIAITCLRNVLTYAHDHGWVEFNQAFYLKGLPQKKEIERWEQHEIDTVLKKAPNHLRWAVMLALYTGQRRSDLIRMQWADYNGDTIALVQQKTKKKMEIPVHKKLKEVLNEIALYNKRRRRLAPYILVNSNGDPWSGRWLSQAMTKFLVKIGIRGKSIHGLRKSAASFLAEAGCTSSQIQAITGHTTLKEVENYTRQAQQKKLAKEAMEKWA